MALTEMAFSPTNGLRDTTTYPKQPTSEAEIRNAIQWQADQLRDYINNTLVAGLTATTESASGAEQIGSEEISGLSGANVHAQLSALKSYIDSAVLGEVEISALIGDGDIASNMLAEDCVDSTKLADGAVTDIAVGDRTIDDTLAPAADTEDLTTLLSNIAYMLRVITGKANWRTAPIKSIETLNSSAAQIETDGAYYGIVVPSGTFIRTPSSGVIPYQEGGGTARCGTSQWPFNEIHGKTIYENGTSLAGKYEAILASDRKRKITISSSSPSGGSDGDIWIKYT